MRCLPSTCTTSLEFNPAYAGSSEALSLNLIYRLQWVGIQGAPRNFLSLHTLPSVIRISGLVYLLTEMSSDPSLDYNLMHICLRIIFPSSKLCFGASGGIKYFSIDWSALNPKDAGDIELTGQVRNKAVPDADFGIYYYAKRYYAGHFFKASVQEQVDVSTSPVDGKLSFTRLLRHFYGMGGVVIPLADQLTFTPSLLVKYVQNAPVQVDVNGSFVIWDILTLGASYRSGDALGLLMEITVAKGLSIGYSYDLWFNALKASNQGSHEIRVGYDVDLSGKTTCFSRYFNF